MRRNDREITDRGAIEALSGPEGLCWHLRKKRKFPVMRNREGKQV